MEASWHEDLLSEGASWLSGPVITPSLVRLDANLEELVLLDKFYSLAEGFKFSEWGIRRGNGDRYRARTFGTLQAMPTRRRMQPQISKLELEQPELCHILMLLGEAAWAKLKEANPRMYSIVDSAPKAAAKWRIGNTPYTSGAVNATVLMPYHLDKGNYSNTGSAMWVSRKYVEGGHLHIPELNSVVDCKHGTLFIFFGERFYHGVTRMRGLCRAGSNRYSMAYYVKKNIVESRTSVY